MKIATWNLQNGDAQTVKGTIGSLFLDDTDVLVLTGCRDAVILKSFLINVGLKYLAFWIPTSEQNGIVIASRKPLLNSANNRVTPQQQMWLEAYLPEQALTILGIHTSDTMDIQEKEAFWQRFIKYAEAQVNAKVIMIGNFSLNTDNLGTIFNFKHYFQSISSLGWIDTWRYFHPITYEQTWFSSAKKGLRLDFIILSPPLEEFLVNAYHSQILHDRKYSQTMPRVLIAELG